MEQNYNTQDSMIQDFSQENFKDYRADLYFKRNNIRIDSFTIEVQTMKSNNAKVPTLRVMGVNMDTGEIINRTVWPRDNATLSDLAKIPTGKVEDFVLRRGFYIEKDPISGLILSVKPSKPKFMGYFVEGKLVKFHGKQHKWNDTDQDFESWENVDDLPKEEPKQEEPKQEEAK